jgi:hypothetical protein
MDIGIPTRQSPIEQLHLTALKLLRGCLDYLWICPTRVTSMEAALDVKL